ncbi:MAG: hypothetical protein B7Z55_13215 [Planctomycetales bacterium 12-60-4]|nr:MAG: hypothetical protein B7Z55_13215 [Planctomycetales bacterium 12-60-4]
MMHLVRLPLTATGRHRKVMRKTPTDCGDSPHRLKRACRMVLVIGVVAGFLPVALVQAQSRFGFTSPIKSSQTVEAAKPRTQLESPVIAAVHIAGSADIDPTWLASSLRSRVGQLPSEQFVADDVATLLASGRFETVDPQWKRTASGWVLTYQVCPTLPRLADAELAWEPSGSGWATWLGPKPEKSGVIIRGQSPDFPEEAEFTHERRQAPGGRAPTLPRAPEDEAESDVGKSSPLLDEPLADVRIEGNVTIPVSEVQKFVKTRPGRTATQSMIKDDVDALVRTRWFISVEPVISRAESGPVLTYRVLERPIVRNVEYRGLVKMKRNKLEALTNLKVGSPYDVSANRECARRIEEMYHEKGHAFATVDCPVRVLTSSGANGSRPMTSASISSARWRLNTS